MNKVEIDRLLTRVSAGDNVAFEKLYEKTKRGVFAFVRTYLHNDADAEDVTQTVYLKIKKGIGGYKAGTNGGAWILQIAKNHALSLLRNAKTETALDDVEYVLAVPEHEMGGGVMEVMEQVLSEEEVRIVTLHVLWQYKHREIAEMLERPTGTVTSAYKRAIEKLRKTLKERNI